MGKYRQHPAEVTSWRLLGHYEKWYDLLTPNEREALGLVRFALDEIAEGKRQGK